MVASKDGVAILALVAVFLSGAASAAVLGLSVEGPSTMATGFGRDVPLDRDFEVPSDVSGIFIDGPPAASAFPPGTSCNVRGEAVVRVVGVDPAHGVLFQVVRTGPMGDTAAFDDCQPGARAFVSSGARPVAAWGDPGSAAAARAAKLSAAAVAWERALREMRVSAERLEAGAAARAQGR